MGWKEVAFEKGEQYPKKRRFGITFSKSIEFECYFDKSCLYDPTQFPKEDWQDINKLIGFSTTYYHHKQSGRFGWRPSLKNPDKIELVTYSYNSGKRDNSDSNVVANVYPEEKFWGKITDYESHYLYEIKKSDPKYGTIRITDTDYKEKDWFFFHYILNPYFGGNNPTPHNMKLYIKPKVLLYF